MQSFRCEFFVRQQTPRRIFQSAAQLVAWLLLWILVWHAAPLRAASPSAEPVAVENIWGAAEAGDVAGLQKFVANGIEIDAQEKGKSALIRALERRQFNAATWLLQHGADANQTTRGGFSALSYAYWAGIAPAPQPYDVRWLNLLLQRGANVDALNRNETMLMRVVGDRPFQPEAFKRILAQHPQLERRKTKSCATALFDSLGSSEAMQLLLEAGANPNVNEMTNAYYGAGDWGYMMYATPLLRAAGLSAGYGERQSTVELQYEEQVWRLLKHGANPRWGGIGGPHEAHLDCPEGKSDGPGVSGTAAPEWVGFDFGQSNPALTQLLGVASPRWTLFDELVRVAQPIAPGEIGFPAIYDAVGQYKGLLARINQNDPAKNPQATAKQLAEYQFMLQRKQSLEYTLHRLLDLDAKVNPAMRVSTQLGWGDLWLTSLDDSTSGLGLLPLYVDEMPDALYLRFLQHGASPAIRTDAFQGDTTPVVPYLIKRGAASKLALLGEYLGTLNSVPPWCGATVHSIAQALQPQFDSRGRASTPPLSSSTGQEAKKIMLTLLRNPRCESDFDDLNALLKNLADAQINQAYAASALWQETQSRRGTPGSLR
jgi:hypothetical protein